MSSEPLRITVWTVDDLADECRRFHDFPFRLEAQSFDATQRTWTGYFIRGSSDSSRITSTYRPWPVKVTAFPIIETAVTIQHVVEAEIQDRSQVGEYTFRQVHRTISGCRFELHQDCDVYVDVDGPFQAEIHDVRELTDTQGRIVSIGPTDFGIDVGFVRPPEAWQRD